MVRSEFEKLPEVEKCLRLGVSWNGDYYEENKDFVYESSDWVNGAWYAFQEQQRKIDAITDLCNSKRGDIHWQVDYFIEEVEELLK